MSVSYSELKAALILVTGKSGSGFSIRKGVDYTYLNAPIAMGKQVQQVLEAFNLKPTLQDTTAEFHVFRVYNREVTDWPTE